MNIPVSYSNFDWSSAVLLLGCYTLSRCCNNFEEDFSSEGYRCYCSYSRGKNCSFEEIIFHSFDMGEASGKFDTNVLMLNLRT